MKIKEKIKRSFNNRLVSIRKLDAKNKESEMKRLADLLDGNIDKEQYLNFKNIISDNNKIGDLDLHSQFVEQLK